MDWSPVVAEKDRSILCGNSKVCRHSLPNFPKVVRLAICEHSQGWQQE
jgi:hypothetical protein